MGLETMNHSRFIKDSDHRIFKGSCYYVIIGHNSIGRYLSLSLELDSAEIFLRVETELNQEIIVDITGIKIALMDTNSCWNVLLLGMFGLIDVGMTVF